MTNPKPSPSHTELLHDLRLIIKQARALSVKSVNSLQVLSNLLIGQRIVEEEQEGKDRAAYGKKTLVIISTTMSKEFGRGYSVTNLEHMRKFYLCYGKYSLHGQPENAVEPPSKTQTLSGILKKKKSQTVSKVLALQEMVKSIPSTLPLSWSHYLFLMGISNEAERKFYEIEANSEDWSIRELKRQYNSSLYERLSLSRDKTGVKELGEKGQIVERNEQSLKDPLVLEFLGLEERIHYSESELETAIIDKLEHFLLELGKGFLFEARQKRFTFDEEHYFVDLVFYNRLLRCYVLIDLKIGELKHQDLGQMQMYVNYFDRYVKLDEEKPTVGIILCKKKKDSLVEITLPKDSNIHASKYQMYLPNKEALKQQLEEVQKDWDAEHDGN